MEPHDLFAEDDDKADNDCNTESRKHGDRIELSVNARDDGGDISEMSYGKRNKSGIGIEIGFAVTAAEFEVEPDIAQKAEKKSRADEHFKPAEIPAVRENEPGKDKEYTNHSLCHGAFRACFFYTHFQKNTEANEPEHTASYVCDDHFR